jgi:sodium/hydrogen exchanger 8
MGNTELNCDQLLYSLIFGESVLNDAVAIVLFKTFLKVYESDKSFTSSQIPSVLLDFLACTIGSVMIGIIIALGCSYLCKTMNLKQYPELEISMLFLFAYGSYSFSEALQLSGIMSLFFCGITLSHYNAYNLSRTSQITSHCIFKSMALLSESFVYLYMGMGFFTGQFRDFKFGFILLVVIFCLIARAFNTFPFSFLANLCRVDKIPTNMQIVIWFSGLRGAIAFALSQNMPGSHKNLYISTTLSIVILTTVICGGLTESILTRMGMKNQETVTVYSDQYEVRLYYNHFLLLFGINILYIHLF